MRCARLIRLRVSKVKLGLSNLLTDVQAEAKGCVPHK